MSDWDYLLTHKDLIKSKKIVVGFDGYIDTTARVIRQSASQDAPAKLFETIEEFGQYLITKAKKSCSVELMVESENLGGNMPYLSQGAGTLGVDVTSIGMIGKSGEVDERFKDLPCKLYPFAPPGTSTCLEFNDGKVLLAPTYSLESQPWELVLKATDGKAADLFQEADLIALVNFSELNFSQELWEGTYEHTLSKTVSDKHKSAFFDLSDISRKSPLEIEKVLSLLGKYSQKRRTTLSLNENEALIIGERLLSITNLHDIGDRILKVYDIDEVLIHTLSQSILMNEKGIHVRETIYIEEPKRSTGAGDHFNAASCFGIVMGLSEEERLKFANQVASYYVRTGQSPTIENIG